MSQITTMQTGKKGFAAEIAEAEQETDAGLGNGGLGRLAACFLDSLATLDMPGFGYGIRYDYGMFTQAIGKDGEQIERPTLWLRHRNFWEIVREDRVYPVRFGGYMRSAINEKGDPESRWEGGAKVLAVAYDTLIPGSGGRTVNHLRLWSGRAVDPFVLYFAVDAVDSKQFPRSIEAATRKTDVLGEVFSTAYDPRLVPN